MQETKQASVVDNRTTAPRAAARFGNVRLERGRFLLECVGAGPVDQHVAAFVDGILIGSSMTMEWVEAGTEVAVNCHKFPCVGMPCQVRFADGPSGMDVAPALTLRSPTEAERLVGPGRIEDVRIAIRNGVIAGHGINRVNGLGKPLLLGRINGDVLREIKLDTPRAREEGGASIDFSLVIDASDLTESGAHYEILALPEMICLAALSFPRADFGALAAAVARNETAIENLSKRLFLEAARVTETTDRRHAEQQRMIHAAVEYLIALVYDRFAYKNREEAEKEESATLLAFRKTLENAARGSAAVDRLDYSAAQPETAYFADGWFATEQDTKGFDFRWMGLRGAIFNPQPHRPVSQIVVSIPTTNLEQEPEITAALDAEWADVELVASPNGAPYTLKVVPRTNGQPRPVQVLRLQSSRASAPLGANDAGDQRLLSIASSGVVFYYDD